MINEWLQLLILIEQNGLSDLLELPQNDYIIRVIPLSAQIICYVNVNKNENVEEYLLLGPNSP